MKRRIAFVVCLLLVLFPIISNGEVWNLGDDFSGTQNPNGVWSFGWRETPEQPLTLFTDNSPINDCDLWWWWDGQMNLGVWHNFHDYPYHCTSIYDYPPHTTYFHPGPTQTTVVRWTAPQDMTVLLAAHFVLWDFGFGGTDIVRVYDNGTELFSATLSDLVQTADYATSRRVRSGDVIECAVEPISYYYDTTQLNFTLETATGACCFPPRVCLQRTQADCDSSGGSYLGDGVPCGPGACYDTPVQETTWGRIRLGYR